MESAPLTATGTDRPPGLSYASSAVSPQCSRAADFQLASLRSDHVSAALNSLHWIWLRVPGRIRFKVAVLVYKVLHSRAPSYLGPFTYVSDLSRRRGLCSSCSDCLVQPPVQRSTVGSRAFSVAGPRVWNCLPLEVTSSPSLATFRTRLKTFLLTKSYPDIQRSSGIFVSTLAVF